MTTRLSLHGLKSSPNCEYPVNNSIISLVLNNNDDVPDRLLLDDHGLDNSQSNWQCRGCWGLLLTLEQSGQTSHATSFGI